MNPYEQYYYQLSQPTQQEDQRLLLFPLLFAAGLAGGFGGWGRPRPCCYPYGYYPYGYGYGYGYPYSPYGGYYY